MNVNELFGLEDQKAIVTGAGRGIGRTLALGLAGAGADIAVVDINLDSAAKTAKEIEGLGRKALTIKIDLTKAQEIKGMVDEVIGKFGRIDILLNNAGVGVVGPAEEMNEEQWDQIMDVNMKGLFFCAQTVGKKMISQGGGKIINIASMSSLIANRPQSSLIYNSSKAGVVMITRSLAAEWADCNIRVNSISPGYTDVEITHYAEHLFDTWKQMIPMKRLAQPEELVGAAIFLASKASSYVTGHNLVVDGGYTIW